VSNEIPAHFVNEYKTVIELLLQQKGSRFQRAVKTDTFFGSGGRPVSQIGQVTAREKITRGAVSPVIETPHTARWVEPRDFDWGDTIDLQDLLRMNNNPESSYVQNGKNALARAMDDVFIQAFFGSNKTGKDGTGTAATFPAANIVAAGGVGMTVDKLRAGMKILRKAEVDFDTETIYCAITAEEVEDLQNETQMISLDYNTSAILVSGKIQPFMGINFIMSERLPFSTGTTRQCPLWAKSGALIATWNGVMTKIDQRADLSYAWYTYVAHTFGATRLEEGKCVSILAVE